MTEEKLDDVEIVKDTDYLPGWLKVICLLFPIVALGVYFSNKSTKPHKARTAATMGWIGFAVGILFRIFGAMTINR